VSTNNPDEFSDRLLSHTKIITRKQINLLPSLHDLWPVHTTRHGPWTRASFLETREHGPC